LTCGQDGCPALPIGTHFLRHSQNGLAAYLAMRCVIVSHAAQVRRSVTRQSPFPEETPRRSYTFQEMMREHTDQSSHGDVLQSRLLEARETFLGYIRKRVDDPELAEDILQDSLLRALQAAPDLRDGSRLVPWFYRILQHAIIDAYRRGAAPRHISLTAGAEPSIEPEDEAALCECFRSLVPTLKAEYAELINAVELGQESPEKAAVRLGVTPNTLKVRRHRARQALRRRLEETCRTCAEHGCLDCTCRPD
jgi:RNA polymerase sigma factor (sigma-70 family)